jgi:hypothetical protein
MGIIEAITKNQGGSVTGSTGVVYGHVIKD